MKFCAACNDSFEDTATFCPRDGEVLEESPETIVGQVLDGKYQVESFIARGGMGAVYRARHILLGDSVVIKTLRSEMRTNAEWLKRFQREGKAARAFRHPNSVTVYDLSAGSDGLIYMVMEYVEGHTLDRELKRRGSFEPSEALEVLEPVADVLDAAHARGVVHRDLKPENIMLGQADDGSTVIKVLDLGIAKMVGAGDAHAASATSLTVAGQILGTPYYMSPEQWGEMPRDGGSEVDGRTDIYSLGVIFFELIAGQKPLGGRTLSELRQKHVASPLPLLHEVAQGVPEEFSRVVARAMAKDRGDRPQTAGELIDELRAALGMTARERGRSMRTTSSHALHVTAQPHADDDATAASSRRSAETLDTSRAETIVTSDFASPGLSPGRETSAQPSRPVTSGNVRSSRARGTVAVSNSADTPFGHTAADTFDDSGVRADEADDEAAPAAVAPKRSLMPLVAGGALALVVVLGVGGWLAWSRKSAGAEGGNVSTNAAPPSAAAPAAKVEALSYWIEVFDDRADTSGERVSDAEATLRSKQGLRFHVRPRERGYLYIIGPGEEGNAQMTILTAKGAGPLKSNLVGAGADFVFPSWDDQRLWLVGNPGAEDYTFIFSPMPLMSPAFLTGEYRHELTPEEVMELEDFRARHKSGAGAAEVKEEGGARRVGVFVTQAANLPTQPVIFDLRINHK